MYCQNCGNEVPEGAKFCGKCGAVMEQSTEQGTEQESINTDKKKRPAIILTGAIGAMVLIVLLLIAEILSLMSHRNAGKESRGGETAVEEGGRVTDEDGNVIITEENIAEAEPIRIEGFLPVDLSRREHTPGEKVSGMEWDKTLFYRLEDTDSLSDDNDNYIAECRVTHYRMYREDSGRDIEYEVYRDPENEAVHKIVSIEETEDGRYELVDYYYVDGKPNFIFQRYDSVYTPTYATLEKPGMRYYFNADTMVRSRCVGEDLKVSQTGLSFQNKEGYEEYDYFDAPEAVKEQYDEAEAEWLNRAYNTYDAVKEGVSIGILRGTVRDTAGSALSGYQIYVQNTEDGKILYQAETAPDGSFSMYVYLDGKDCQLYAAGNETYEGTYVYGIKLEDSALYYNYDPVILHRFDGDSYPVTLQLCNAGELDTGAEVSAGGVAGADIVVRKGTDARRGATVCEDKTGENGAATLTLPAGSYTAKISCDGYATNYINLEVTDSALSRDIYMIKAPSAGQTAVLLTWDSEMGKDLDLTIFTPYQAGEGDMARIGGGVLSDEYGNYILHDNSMGCEVAYLDAAKSGPYKIYVNDYTDSQAGNYDTNIFSRLDVHIYIYRQGGDVTELHVPGDENGVVWEVAELTGSRVSVTGRIYVQPTGKRWWVEDKAFCNQLELSEEDIGVLEGISEYIANNPEWQYNYMDSYHYFSVEQIGNAINDNFFLFELIEMCGGTREYENELYFETEYCSKYVMHGALEDAKRIYRELFNVELDVNRLAEYDQNVEGEGYNCSVQYNADYEELVWITVDCGWLPWSEYTGYVYDETVGCYVISIDNYCGDYAGKSYFYLKPTTENSFGFKILGVDWIVPDDTLYHFIGVGADSDSSPAYREDGSELYYEDLTENFGALGEEWIDLDNDGKLELYLGRDVFELYGGIVIDARDGVPYVLAEGNGTAVYLSFVYYQGKYWRVTSDTTHAGRTIFWLEEYSGNGNVVNEISLMAEYEGQSDYDETSTFTLNDKKISMHEYEAMVSKIFGE